MTTEGARPARWSAARVQWRDETDRRRLLATAAARLHGRPWFSAEVPDDQTELAWRVDQGDPALPSAVGGAVVASGLVPRLLDASLNGFDAPDAYALLLSLTTGRAARLLVRAGDDGPMDVGSELAAVWCSLLPDHGGRTTVLGEGAAWLERRAAAAEDAVGAAGGGGPAPAGRALTVPPLASASPAPDGGLTAVGVSLRESCDEGPFVQLCCRAVHVHKVRLVPLAGRDDVAAELRAEAALWRAIAAR